ncbi:MAG: histidinol-phosphate transaminase [Proteobacteria bacterium]|nr:histidinol-phosphate transaminase [Pseudomonadota bacterium]MBU1389172.1 histidinol-phosphate transaminase [Pseudomonadota bacterium]MBU1543396.1 histidinol-phosphate transaminase [Pseudomonadota bacterium]MBU2430204.1 histidinol-phosphate transaminase [Pseudomonadota bacterium]MBU2482909.1 histidinol-phosphate transaminase [Pseudomonadota bacterium]
MKFKCSSQIEAIKPYEAGKPLKEFAREYKMDKVIKLASNENALGFSPRVHDAVIRNLSQMNRYPEPVPHELCQKLAQKFNVSKKNIVIGNGSDDIIALLAHGYLNPGEEALMPLPSFLMYEISVRTAKGKPVMVPLVDFTTNLDGLIEKLTPQTRMVFITNPFNPTGASITTDDFNRFAQKVPDDVLIVVDEAYIEFVRDAAVYNSLARPLKDKRIVTLRTFSKAYGLAGFRVGYGIMDEQIAQILNRIRQPFNVNGLAQVAAVAALEDDIFLNQSITATHDGLDYLFSELNKMEIECLPTQANFFMLNVKADATKVFEDMLQYGVIVRSMKSYGYNTYLRINTGTMDENSAFIDALKQVLQKQAR